eukprot:362776-Chlamydomonas_euryale.AAC.8
MLGLRMERAVALPMGVRPSPSSDDRSDVGCSAPAAVAGRSRQVTTSGGSAQPSGPCSSATGIEAECLDRL